MLPLLVKMKNTYTLPLTNFYPSFICLVRKNISYQIDGQILSGRKIVIQKREKKNYENVPERILNH